MPREAPRGIEQVQILCILPWDQLNLPLMLKSEKDIPIEYTPKTGKMSRISDKHSDALLGKNILILGPPESLRGFAPLKKTITQIFIEPIC